MKRYSLFFILMACCFYTMELQAIVPSSQKIRLNEGWEFIRQDLADVWEVVRPARAGQPEIVPLWSPVTLPHCFNAEDAVDPDVNYYQGAGWYKTSLSIDNPYTNGRVLLDFEGAGQKTEVYVYTTRVGSHVGGYDGWKVDITDAVAAFARTETCQKQFGGKIPVSVRCDNSRDREMIPSDMSDFNLYGGLYRYVTLVYVPSVSFEQIHIDARCDEMGKNGTFTIRTSLYQPAKEAVNASLTLTVKAPDGKQIYTQRFDNLTEQVSTPEIAVKKPVLWHVDKPQLYTCQLTLEVDGQQLQAEERFGFRHFVFREKGPFFLNGQRLLLRGTHRHEDHAGVAAALTEEIMVQEMQQIKAMGVNFIRLGHYQQSDIVLRLCDELGILVWEEIPWCRGGLGGDTYKEQARRMLTNMIGQHYNHPSVILWGMGNENDWAGDFATFDKEAIRAFMKELHDLSHQLDPQRLTAIRRCEFCKDIIDVYSPSIWAGWYSRAYKDYMEMETAGMQGTTRFLHAEWGGDSHARRHMEGDFEGVSNAAKTGDWSESYIIRLFDWHLKEQENMPWLTGAAFWTFKDFSTPLRPENPVPYVNQKGVIERDGTPKESYYVFQSYWSKEPMLHIYGHTWPTRWGKPGEKKEVLVYSNCPEVELFVNGISQGKKRRNSQDFPAAGLRWEVPYNEGANNLRAVAATKNGSFTDEIKQNYQTAVWGTPAQIRLTATPLTGNEVMVQAELLDAAGIPCLDSQDYIEFEAIGAGRLVQNQGTSTGARKLQAYNGRACIRVAQLDESKGISDTSTYILAKSASLTSNLLTIFADK